MTFEIPLPPTPVPETERLILRDFTRMVCLDVAKK